MADSSLASLLRADIEAHCRHFGARRPLPIWVDCCLLALNPYFCPVLLCRLAHHLGGRPLLGKVGVVVARLNYFLFGIEIARQTAIGPGLFFPHTRGTVIGAAQIGSGAVIYHGVTLGARNIDADFDPTSRPVIGDNVVIGAGAKVVGGINIGDGARIGPNAVIIKDVPPGAVMVSLPPIQVGEPR